MPGLAAGLDFDRLFAPLAGADRLGLAVSGGPDSLALMLLASRWAAAAPGRPQLIVYSVDHGLRPEAAEEVAMVLREAARLGLPARGLAWRGDKPETGVQAAARRARYRLLADAMQADGVRLLLTGHHMGDQAETVLMRLAHGSGLEGLRGMDAVSTVEGCRIARPLLAVHPDRLHEVVHAAGLTPALDPSNADHGYERVRWRRLLPELEAMGLTRDRLATLARRLGEANAVLGSAADSAWRELAIDKGDGGMALTHAGLAALNPQIGTQVLGEALQRVSGDRRPLPLGALEALFVTLAEAAPMKPATLHGCVVSSDGQAIAIRREGPRRAVLKTQAAVTAN